jgi:AcrR family transcriptional regulator
MQQRGFHGFSYHHIATRLGIRNAAVHYYFPAKADLGVALIGRFQENFRFWTEQLALRRATPAAAIEGFFEIESRYCAQGRVCPLGVTGVEFPGIPQAMREAVQQLLGEVRGWLAENLEAGRERGDFRFAGSADARADVMLATLQGGLQLARIADPAGFDRVVAQLREDLGMTEAARAAVYRAAG